MGAKYISIYYHGRRNGEPYQTYVEIDSFRRETRKVGVFDGGLAKRVGVDQPNADFSLGFDPVIDFVGEVSTGGAFLEEIDGAWFEQLWDEAGTGSMAFIEDDPATPF